MAVTPSSSALKRPLSAFSQQSNESRKRHALETNASSLSISSEQQRRAFEADLTRLQVQLRDTQSEILDVQSQLADKDAQVSSLERERSSLLARWDEKLEEQRESDRAETDIRNHALRREVDELQLRLSETRQEAEEAKFSAREAHHQRSMALHAQEATQNTNNELSEQLESLRQELRQAQAKHQQSPAHSPSKPKPSSSHDKILGKELSSALSRLKSLEHDNQRLKREHARLLANAEHSALLRERLASAESRAKQVPALQNKLAQCDLARSILESEQRAWHVYLIDEEQDESDSHQRKRPEDIVKETARVKSQNEVLHRRLEMAKETQDGMNHLVACLEGRIDELEAQVDAEKVKHTGLKKSIKSYERCVQY